MSDHLSHCIKRNPNSIFRNSSKNCFVIFLNYFRITICCCIIYESINFRIRIECTVSAFTSFIACKKCTVCIIWFCVSNPACKTCFMFAKSCFFVECGVFHLLNLHCNTDFSKVSLNDCRTLSSHIASKVYCEFKSISHSCFCKKFFSCFYVVIIFNNCIIVSDSRWSNVVIECSTFIINSCCNDIFFVDCVIDCLTNKFVIKRSFCCVHDEHFNTCTIFFIKVEIFVIANSLSISCRNVNHSVDFACFKSNCTSGVFQVNEEVDSIVLSSSFRIEVIIILHK